MAKKVFGDWQKRDLPTDTYIDPPDPTRRLIVVNKPDAVQTEVRVGHIGIPRGHPDYLAVNLAIRILGGEGSNRLHQVLRTERGLTYGAQANMDALKVSGDFEAQTNTRSEATGEVAAPDRGRVLAAAARARRRTRVGGRQGVHDRQFSPHHRNAGCDRPAGRERRVLRATARPAADSSVSV